MKPLAHFKPGGRVKISCYKPGCGQIPPTTVTLGQEYKVHPSFVQSGRVGRLSWRPTAATKGFELGERSGGSGYLKCLGCKTLFGSVIIISNGQGMRPTILGYDPEPA